MFPIKNRSDVFDRSSEYPTAAERRVGSKLQYLQSDGGGEYLSEKFTSFFKARGIVHTQTCAYTPQRNRVAERMNCTILNAARARLNQKFVPKELRSQ